jgi:hypothetical protein
MKTTLTTLALMTATGLLTGCQTSLLKPEPGITASATVKHPIFWGSTQITVSLNGKTFNGTANESSHDISGEQAILFGWQSDHRHPNIKQEMRFLLGETILTANDGAKLACSHLRHGDDWRLRCKTAQSNEIAFYRVKHY